MWDLYREFSPNAEPYEAVFAVIEASEVPAPAEGFGADYGAALIVKRVLYVAREGFGCEFDLSGFRFRAHGNEPFWNIVVSDSTILLRRLGEDDLVWALIEESQLANGSRFVGQVAESDQASVEIMRRDCRDSMSGAYFGYSAAARIGDAVFTGCALKGHCSSAGG
jgi:uncharacterized membrane protein